MPAQHATVLFQVPARGIRRLEIREFACRVQQEVAAGHTFTCLVTSDAELAAWNRQYRKKNYPTDVLSFPSGNPNEGIGELAISFDRAREQALEHGHSSAEELRILMLHGVLHLIGLDHERDNGQMAKAERRWRKHYGLPAGLIERVSR
jgi:probable rRNA maturation factor